MAMSQASLPSLYKIRNLQDLLSDYVATNFRQYSTEDLARLPCPVLNDLKPRLSPLNLRRLEVELRMAEDDHKDLWLDHYRKVFPIYYRSMFKAFRTNENAFCVAPKKSTNLRRAFLEDHFHTLLEDANKITLLIQRGVLEVNLAESLKGDRTCCTVRIEQIKEDMLLCAPFVKSLKVFRSRVLMTPMLKDVLDVLVNTVVCIRLVFLHDYRVLKETMDYFMAHGKILDFHTTWQPQQCSLPSKYSVEILTLLAGLQLENVNIVEDTEDNGSPSVAESPYDLYDIAVAGSRIDPQLSDVVFECAAKQLGHAATHISISSFILTQHTEVHNFMANTLLPRWASLQSIKLACLNHIDIDIFKSAIVNLVEHHKLRHICFEDTQFTDPMDLFLSLLRVSMRYKTIVLEKLTMLGIGHPFIGDHAYEIQQAGEFEAIQELDLSFSSLINPTCVPTFCEYIKRDRALRMLNINCCKLIPGKPTAQLLSAIGVSTLSELILDFNPINSPVLESALIGMLTTNKRFTKLSFTLCTFSQVFVKERLFPALAEQPLLTKLYLAENRLGDLPELETLLISLLSTRSYLSYLDLSSNFLSGAFLMNLVVKLTNISGGRQIFHGLNLSFNLDRGEVLPNKGLVRSRFSALCAHFFCMILYEDPAEPARHEHMAQM